MERNDIEGALSRGRGRKSGRTWRCPADADLAAFADGALDEKRRSRVERHVADCSYCLQQLSALAMPSSELENPPVSEELVARARGLVEEERRQPALSIWNWKAFTGAAAVAVLGLVFLIRTPVNSLPSPDPVGQEAVQSQPVGGGLSGNGEPAASQAPAVRTARPGDNTPVVHLPPNAKFGAPDELPLAWSPVEKALYYEVAILTEEGDVAWQQRTETTAATLPAGVRARLKGKYYVSVRASLPDGRSVRSRAAGIDLLDLNN